MLSFIRALTNAVLAATLAGTSFAADIDVNIRSHQVTTPPSGARFEVIQSTLAAKWTFRLDRYSGRIWMLVKTPDDDNAWEEMPVQERPQIQTPSRARFQLFTSGLAARHTFLLDADTGKSWLIVTGKRKDKEGNDIEYQVWQPFAQQ